MFENSYLFLPEVIYLVTTLQSLIKTAYNDSWTLNHFLFLKKYLKLPTWQRNSFYYSFVRLHGPTASLLLFDLRSCRKYSWWPLPGLHLLMPRRMSGDRGALHQEELLLRLRQRQIPKKEVQAGSGQEASQLEKQVMEGLN